MILEPKITPEEAAEIIKKHHAANGDVEALISERPELTCGLNLALGPQTKPKGKVATTEPRMTRI